jgi:hypothetical protein
MDLDGEGGQLPASVITMAVIITVAMWAVLIIAVLVSAAHDRARRSDIQLAQIDDRLAAIHAEQVAFGRRADAAFVVLHDGIHAVGEGHTEDLAKLTRTIKEWGDEKEFDGEFTGYRNAAGVAGATDVDASSRAPRPRNGRSPSPRGLHGVS